MMYCEVDVVQSLVLLCSVLWINVCLFVLFPLAIVLSVLLRFKASHYPLYYPLLLVAMRLNIIPASQINTKNY